jgi:hypothetical protein
MSFTWLVTERLVRPVNLEMVQFVELRKCYVQTVFTFWMTLIHLKCWYLFTELCSVTSERNIVLTFATVRTSTLMVIFLGSDYFCSSSCHECDG